MGSVVAKFHKVPEEEFNKVNDGAVDYSEIQIPKRSTKGSAGYDFVSTVDLSLAPGETALVRTGICCEIQEGWFLLLAPRSGLGFKFRMQLDNTVGIIDQDYYGNPDNFGHIMVKVTNDGKSGKTLNIKKGEKFVQGIFLPYGLAEGDDTNSERLGGFGSTGK